MTNLHLIYKQVFCYTLASKSFIRKDIDKIFNQNSLKYIKELQNSNIKDSSLYKSFDFQTELYSQKVIGILECDLLNKNYTNITSLYSKAFNKIYRNLKNKKIISISNIINYLDNNIEDSFNLITSVYFFYVTSSIYYSNEKEKDVLNIVSQEILALNSYGDLNFSNKTLEMFSSDLNYFKDKFNIKKRDYSLNELINTILSIDLYKMNYLDDFNNLKNIEINQGYNIVQKKGIWGKFIGANEGYFKYLGYDASKFSKTIFSKKEINQMLMNLYLAKKFNNFTDEECTAFFINIMYSMTLNKEYRAMRKEYIQFINGENLLNINKLQSELKKSKDDILKYKNDLDLKEKAIINSNNELLIKLKSLEKENKNLKEKLKETENLKDEVIKLRNINFSLINNEIDKSDCNINTYNIEELNNINLVIVGGTINWINKMKEKLPNAKFITNENKNISFSFFKNVDMVFLNIKMTHSLYFKAKSYVDKYNTKYDFIENTENITNSLQDIYKKYFNN